jgi:hypothetical protein
VRTTGVLHWIDLLIAQRTGNSRKAAQDAYSAVEGLLEAAEAVIDALYRDHGENTPEIGALRAAIARAKAGVAAEEISNG